MSNQKENEWASDPWLGGRAEGSLEAHLSHDVLVEGYEALPPPPTCRGTVRAVVCRQADWHRTTPAQIHLCPERGVVGDRWIDGKALPRMQVAIMRVDVAHLIAAGQHPALFGDNLLVDLDLSTEHVPPGTRLRVGTAECVVSEEPHNGCSQFSQRFGPAALRLTADKRWLHQRLRGIYLTILKSGDVAPGDPIEIIA